MWGMWGLVFVGLGQIGVFIWQLRLIRRSLDVAKDASDAAKEAADATKEQIEIARQEFLATHRPKIIIRRISGCLGGLTSGKFREIICVAHNSGETDAIVYEYIVVGAFLEEEIPNNPFPESLELRQKEIIIHAGETKEFPVNIIYINRNPETIEENKTLLAHCVGLIKYKDTNPTNGICRETGFHRRYDDGRFSKIDGSDYEYTD